MSKRLLAGVALSVFLSGCGIAVGAVRSHSENKMNEGMVGMDIHQVVSQWGPPFAVVENGQFRIYEWRWSGGGVIQASPAPFSGMAAGPTTYRYQEYSCRRWYEVDSGGIIRGRHWQGVC